MAGAERETGACDVTSSMTSSVTRLVGIERRGPAVCSGRREVAEWTATVSLPVRDPNMLDTTQNDAQKHLSICHSVKLNFYRQFIIIIIIIIIWIFSVA